MKKKKIILLIIGVFFLIALFSVGELLLWHRVEQHNLRGFPSQNGEDYPAEHRGRAFPLYYDIIATGTYRLIATEILDGAERPIEIHQKNGMMMTTFEEGRMIIKDGKTYALLEGLDGFYVQFDSPAPPWDPADDTHGISFVRFGRAEFDEREVHYEKYEFENGNTKIFFFDGDFFDDDALVGFRMFSVLFNRTTDTIIHILDNNVSSEVFEIPADYQEFDPDIHRDLIPDNFGG